MRYPIVVAITLVAGCWPSQGGHEEARPLVPEEVPILDVAEPRGDDTFVVEGPMMQFSAEFLDDGTPVFIGGDSRVLAGREADGSPVVWCPHSLIFASPDRERVYNATGQALGEEQDLDRYAVAFEPIQAGQGMTASRVIHVLDVEARTQTTITDVSGADSDCALTEPIVAHP